MAKVQDFTQKIATGYTSDNQFVSIEVTDKYRIKTATMDQYDYDKQDACIAGRFRWYGKCTVGAAWILWRNITLLDCNEVEKAIKICKIIYERHNTSLDSVEWQDKVFWNMMEGKKIVRRGKGVIEWVTA